MIKQCAVTAINSRSECNPFDKTGFLPIITSNMYSVVDKHNAHIFLDNKVKVCMPRKEYMDGSYQHCSDENYFDSFSLDDFIKDFIETSDGFLHDNHGNKVKTSVCIDTAAGHLLKLHDAIRQAKQVHGDKLIIMAGNVASVEAFVELAKTGVDYIRVGIGGGGGCNTTSNTGVGQGDLEQLIHECDKVRIVAKEVCQKVETPLSYGATFMRHRDLPWLTTGREEFDKFAKVKIIADGISTYIKQCESKYGFNDNGYAAINKLLFAGSDLVMVGKLFAQCYESAGKKGVSYYDSDDNETHGSKYSKEQLLEEFKLGQMTVKYSGMSTQLEQKNYRKDFDSTCYTLNINWGGLAAPARVEGNIVYEDWDDNRVEKQYFLSDTIDLLEWWHIDNKECIKYKDTLLLKPSEGSVQWIPVRWTLQEWLHGSDKQDQSPYLMGWLNSIRSAMAYTNQTNLCGNC